MIDNPKNIAISLEYKDPETREMVKMEWRGETPLYANNQVGTDCYPYEVVAIVSPTRIKIRRMDTEADRENGHEYYGNQVYKYISQPEAETKTLSRRKRGWAVVGDNGKYVSKYWLADYPRYYQDPHF